MDREIVLGFLIASGLAPLLASSAMLTRQPTPSECAWLWERRCWRSLWLPFLPLAVFLAVLLGWALREPENAEPVPLLLAVLAVPSLFVSLRALTRFLVASKRAQSPLAGTVGLMRPRAVLSERLVELLDPAQLSAAREHELAHERHHDPLRILLARLATDLQWPLRTASDRFDCWLAALEVARDEEARLRGIDGADLASAILIVTRLGQREALSGAARLANEADFSLRLRLLLDPLSHGTHPSPSPLGRIVLIPVLLASVATGLLYGEVLVRSLLRL